jgi:hypothetical protein
MAATGTTTSAEKGRRIVGAERQTLAKDLVKRYTSGESIRALASSTGRPAASARRCPPAQEGVTRRFARFKSLARVKQRRIEP